MRVGSPMHLDRLLAELRSDPDLHYTLRAMVQIELDESGGQFWMGWEQTEVHASLRQMRRLNERGVIKPSYHSGKYRRWVLTDRALAQEALATWMAEASAADAVTIALPPADLFDVVVGCERALETIRRALESDRPVHVLLEGPPASAKSLILDELGRLPFARRTGGAMTTKAGIVGYLLAERSCRHLIIDEIDAADGRDLVVLHDLMASGLVTAMQHGRQVQEPREVWVWAATNDAGRLSRALRSRFWLVELAPYTDEQFRAVTLAVLVRREGCDEELAAEVATAVAPLTRDVRQAVNVARLCGGDRRLVAGFVRDLASR